MVEEKLLVRYTLRVNRNLFKKFRHIADYKGRSANRAIEHLMKLEVKKFEEEHGVIEIYDENEK